MKKRLLLPSVTALIAIVLASFAPTVLARPPPPGGTYSGSGTLYFPAPWLPLFTWYSSTTVNTRTNTLTFTAVFPPAWSNLLKSVAFVSGIVMFQDKTHTWAIPWYFEMCYKDYYGTMYFTITQPYGNSNTGLYAIVDWFYVGVSWTGGPTADIKTVEYYFYVGA